jgi:hypothetical protein
LAERSDRGLDSSPSLEVSHRSGQKGPYRIEQPELGLCVLGWP